MAPFGCELPLRSFAISRFVAMPTSAMASVSCIACNPILPAQSPSLWRRYHGTPLLESMPTRISCRNAVGKPQCCLPSSSSPSSSSLECSSDSASSSSRAASRRDMLILAGGGAAAAAFPSSAQEVDEEEVGIAAADTTITDRIYIDLMVCPSLARSDRTLGNTSLICAEGENLGQIVVGLYGKQVPQIASNFKAMCTGQAGSSYEGTIFHRVLQGQYIQAGRQGSKDKGEVVTPTNLDRNKELISARSFKLRHSRPGTVSLCLSENDDEDALKLSGDYRNVEFLITTGPGPAPQLDNGNIVFGTVIEGMDVVSAISTVPTYKPSSRIRQFNDLAEFFGDDRAANARSLWNKPLKAIVIKSCGLVNAANTARLP